MENYHPISLPSHLAKFAERMVSAQLTHIADREGMIPPEKLGFRPGRAEDKSLARLIQTAQNGWNRPKPRSRPQEESTADKFVLLAFDFSRAYGTVDHKMLHIKLPRTLPKCLAK